jgi:phosphate transport system substrate-binding protein
LKNAEAPYALTDYLPTAIDSSWWVTPIGQDGIAIIVNPANPIVNLTAAQLRSILQGRVASWKTLGGADTPVTVVARNERSSAAAVIQSVVLGQRQTTRAARLATTNEAVIQIVAKDPGAIGYVSMGYLDSSVRAVPLDGIAITPDTVTGHQYPISTPIVFVGLAAPANDAYRAFFAWIQSPDGQSIVRRHYGGLVNQ